MRDIRQGLCPLCDHNEIIESAHAEFGEQSLEQAAAVTYDARWLQGGRNPRYPHGVLTTYTCRKCGFTQWFAESPGSIPVDDDHRTRLIRGPDKGLYR